jgi:hypothetical protein
MVEGFPLMDRPLGVMTCTRRHRGGHLTIFCGDQAMRPWGMVEGFPPNEAMHVGHGGNNSPPAGPFLGNG